jgi:Holliday junction resolvasome RuvABC DNA-binding subunit
MGTPMTAVTGIGPAAAAVLGEHGFDSAEALAKSSINALVKVPGFGQVRAAMIKEAAQDVIKSAKKGAGGKKGKKGKVKKIAKRGKADSKKNKKTKKVKKEKSGKAKGKKAKGRKKR